MVYLKLLHCRFEKRTRIIYTIMLGFTMIILLITAIYDAHLIHFVRNWSKSKLFSVKSYGPYHMVLMVHKICRLINFKAGAFLAKMKLKYLAGTRFFYYLNIFWWWLYLLMLLIYSPKKFQFVIFQMKVDFSKIDWIIRHRFYTINDSRDHLNPIFIWIKQDQFKL